MRRHSAASLLAIALLSLTGCGGASDAGPSVVEESPREVIVPEILPATPVIPSIDAAMKERLRAVLADGRARGNRDDVFAKVGDSNTAIPDFLKPIGCGEVIYGPWESLRAVVERWSATPVVRGWELNPCEASNSFTRIGSAAFPGWRTSDFLRAHEPHPTECQPPDDVSVRCELSQIKPSVALVMVGTNDMLHPETQEPDPGAREQSREELRRLIREIIDAGVIPVVSTLPPRRHPPSSEFLPPLWNEMIIEVAAEEQVPLWNYWLALQSASQFGMSYDWLHPSPAPTGAGDLRNEAMDWGFNVRNLTALQVLEKVGRIVIDDGPPDP
jgi:hypothetical protein